MVDRTDGPFEFYQEIHAGVNGDTIRSDAHDPGLNATTIGVLAGELEGDSRLVAGQLSGDITADVQVNPDTASATARTLAAKGHYAVGLVSSFADMVDAFDTTVSSLNQRYRNDLASAMRYAGQGAALTVDPADDAKVTVANMGPPIRAFLQPEYTAAVNQLDNDADSVATRFKQGATSENVAGLVAAGLIPLSAAAFYPGLTLTDSDRSSYYRSVMRDMDPEERAQYILDHEEISGPVLDGILEHDTATSNEIGKHVEDRTSDIDHDTSNDDVQGVVDLLDRFQHSNEVSAGIINQIGGDGLIALVSIAGSRLYSSGHDSSNLALARLTRDVFRAGEPTLADHSPLAARQLATSMVDVFREPDNRSEQPGNDPYSLSYLLRDSTLSTPFLDSMGDGLDDFERNTMGENNMTWRGMSQMSYGGGWMFDEGEIEGAFDPVASYMSALGNNGEASLEFFTAGGDDTDPDAEMASDRQEYWIEDRYWSHDKFDGITSALDSATTDPDILADTGDPDDPDDGGRARQAAELMSETVNHLDERQENDFGIGGENFNPGDVSDTGTTHIAHMLSTYMPSVDAALQAGERTDFATGVQVLTDDRFNDMSNMPIFDGSALRNMTDVAVSTEDGFDSMRHGLNTYQNMQLHNSIEDDRLVNDETSQADARLEGFFVNSVGDTRIGEAEDTDARVQSWIDMGKGVVGAVPIPGGQVVEFLASQAIDAGAGGLSDHYTNNEDREVDSSNDYAGAALSARHEVFQQALVNGGAITPSDVAAELTGGDNPQYTDAEVGAWFPDGQFPSQSQYDDLSDGERTDMRNALATVVGNNDLSDTTNYNHTYESMFEEYFEKGDGDGN